jgi:2-aminoadipate transaminase
MTIESSHYSSATRRVQPSAIRELFALLSLSDVISFAGGFPCAAALKYLGSPICSFEKTGARGDAMR